MPHVPFSTARHDTQKPFDQQHTGYKPRVWNIILDLSGAPRVPSVACGVTTVVARLSPASILTKLLTLHSHIIKTGVSRTSDVFLVHRNFQRMVRRMCQRQVAANDV